MHGDYVINVQDNAGFRPDIILLTLRYYGHGGARLNAMKSFVYLQPIIFPPKRFDNFPP